MNRPSRLDTPMIDVGPDQLINLTGLTLDEIEDLYYGHVSRRIREMCKFAFDSHWDDKLKANAAKPVRLAKGTR